MMLASALAAASLLTFDEARHEYRVGGVVVPSVTQILRPIRPDFSAISPEVLERKRALGTAVHLACELDDDGELDDETLDDALQPYVAAWRKFKAEQRVEIIFNEKKLHHPRLMYAGTLDRVVEFPDGEMWLLDLKTSTDPHPSYGVQTAAYAELLEANELMRGITPKRGTLHLDDDGRYRLRPNNNPNDVACFRALLSIHQWKETAK